MPTEQTTELNEKHPPQATAPPLTELSVTGMTCGNCARHVTEAIQSVPGVRSAVVSLDDGKASVRWAPDREQNARAVIQAVKEAGYDARVIDAHTHQHADHRLAGWQINLWIGLLGTAPLMLGEWIFRLGTAAWFQWFSFALA